MASKGLRDLSWLARLLGRKDTTQSLADPKESLQPPVGISLSKLRQVNMLDGGGGTHISRDDGRSWRTSRRKWRGWCRDGGHAICKTDGFAVALYTEAPVAWLAAGWPERLSVFDWI